MSTLPNPAIPTHPGQRQRTRLSDRGNRWHLCDILKLREGIHEAQGKRHSVKRRTTEYKGRRYAGTKIKEAEPSWIS